ncbi:MAG: hypothetical protein ACPGWR_16490 [Ardenticatenaceae bacterium]
MNNQEIEFHWSAVVHVESEHVIRGVLMEVQKVDTKKATLEPIDDLFRDEEGELTLWCREMICGEYVELEGKTFQVTTVSTKKMILEPCDIAPDTPRWSKEEHLKQLHQAQERAQQQELDM